MNRHHTGRAFAILLLTGLLVGSALWRPETAAAINAPTITHIHQRPVVPGQYNYASTTTGIVVQGNSEADMIIYLYRNGANTYSGTADGNGVWSIPLGTLGEGTYTLAAQAFDGDLFTSSLSPNAQLMVDVTPPSISLRWDIGYWQAFKPYLWTYADGLRSLCSDSRSGCDWTTCGMRVTDLTAGNVVIPGLVDNDSASFIDWRPADGNWNGAVRVHEHQYTVEGWITDKAGNTRLESYTYWIDTVMPTAPVVEYVYDPNHHTITGNGEPIDNLPDAEGWVRYYASMTVSTNPPKLKGYVNPFSLPQGFEAHWVNSCQRAFGNWSCTVDSSGRWQLNFDVPFCFGRHDVTVLSKQAAQRHSCEGTSTPVQWYFDAGKPPKPVGISYTGSTNCIRKADDLLLQPFSVTLAQVPFKQRAVLDDTMGNVFRYARVLYPSGWSYTNTPGSYDEGEIFKDTDGDAEWDPGELFLDEAGKGVSDGKTVQFPNFLDINLPSYGRTCIRVYAVNEYGWSPCLNVARHGTNVSNAPRVKQMILSPSPGLVERRNATRPTSLLSQALTWAWNGYGTAAGYQCCGWWYLNTGASTIRIVNGLGNEVMAPSTGVGWAKIDNKTMENTFDLSAVPLPDATYVIEARYEDLFGNVMTNSSTTFKIDNVPPNPSEVVPPDGATSNSFTSFSAQIVDGNLPDGTSGTGANIDVSKPQIWPYRKVVAEQVFNNSQSEKPFPVLGPIAGKAVDHREQPINIGAVLEACEMISGQITENKMNVVVTDNSASKLTCNASPNTFTKDKTWVILYPIPHFTANNGVDRVGAVPVA